MTPQELTALAKTLKLTPRKKLFCEVLAADPEKNQRQAMLKAGYAGGEAGAAVTATRVLKQVNAQIYLAAVMDSAIKKAERETGRRIANIAETLETLTDQMRGTRPARRRTTPGIEGEACEFDMKGAAEALLRYQGDDHSLAAEMQRKLDTASRLWKEFMEARPDVARDFHIHMLKNSETPRLIGESTAA